MSITNILSAELNQLLKEYFDSTTLNNLYDSVRDKIAPNFSETLSESDRKQISANIPNGAEQRILLDLITTSAKKQLSEIKYFNLLLKFSELMIYNGELNFARELAEEVLDSTKFDEANCKLTAEAYLISAKIDWSQAYWKESTQNTDMAYEIFNELNDKSGCAKCENMFGTIFGEQGKIKQASHHFERGLALLKETRNSELEAAFEVNLGILYTMIDENEKALNYLMSGLEKFEAKQDMRRVARINHNIGMLHLRTCKFEEAIAAFDICLNVSLDFGYLSNCAIAYLGKAWIKNHLGATEIADAFTHKAMEIAYKINDKLSIAEVYRIKGLINQNMNDFNLSEEFFESCVRLNRDFDNTFNESEGNLHLIEIYKNKNLLDRTLPLVKKSADYYNQIRRMTAG
ncbi:MAG: hypothetical protein FJ213_07045 [Ignavibacteria bacterium]|nr:hypothetical protein [Ignavibacteria bacterium]